MDENCTLEEFIKYKQNSFYGFDGLHDSNTIVPPCHIYKLYAEDFFFNEEENTLTLNIGKYYDKKLEYLLTSLFIPLDELSFDLGKYIKYSKTKLVLNNTIENLNDNFFSTVYSFFEKLELKPIYIGIWEK